MFISRLEMPWQTARNPYQVHREIWRLFPGEARETRRERDEERQGFLFRIEDYRAGYPTRLLVQSHRQPQPVTSSTLAGSREFNPQPQVGQRLAFVLTANPIKTVTDVEAETKPDKRPNKKGKFKCRVPLISEEEQLTWLAGKLEEAATIEALTVLPHPPLYFRKGNQGGKLMIVTFEGVLQVNAPNHLIRMLQNGIGPAKAFGCGLMLVRRV